MNQIRVRRAKHASRNGRHNWIVEDGSGGKVFVRSFTFSFFGAAILEADRLARTGQIKPWALFGVERIEYDRNV
jgi:hypothetical protein